MIRIIDARRPKDTDPEIELEQAEFFRALPPSQIQGVRAVLRERTVERGRLIFFGGKPAEYLWVLRRGQVRLYKSSSGGRVTTLEVLGPGEIFGAVSALEEETYPASAEAIVGSAAWCLPRSVFSRLLKEHPHLAVEILQIVSRRLRDAHERLRSFAHDPARSRLASALLRSSRAGEARVTRRALAEAAGTTVETAIRVLRRFEQDGLVKGAVGRVSLLDEPALRRIATPAGP